MMISLSNDDEKKKSNGVSLNFSAIVGKNGDGKSTIIELVARIINNLARAKNFCTKDDNLIPVKGVSTELYYEFDGNIL